MSAPSEQPSFPVKSSAPRAESLAPPPIPAEPDRQPAFKSGNDVAYELAKKRNPNLPPPTRPKKTLGGKFVPPLKSTAPSRMTADEKEVAAFPTNSQVSRQVFANKQSAGGKSNDGAEIDNINGVPLDDERLRNIEPRLLQLIQNEILDRAQKIVWDDIAGLKMAKQTITEMIIMPLLRPDIFTGIRKPPRGLLLFGPPGTGKTMIGRAIASECDSTFFSISASSLTSKWVGEGEKMVRALFAVASCYSPAVIFIDEIDSLLTARSEKEDDSARRIKTEFLIQLEGATNESDAMILLIGATNRPQELDEAARRRLAKRLYIPLPDQEARCDLLRRLLSKGIQHSLTDGQLSHLASLSKGYSGADISLLVQDAALYPIREIPDIRTISPKDVRPLNLQDFERALRVVKASVGSESLAQYRDWNHKFGSADLPDGD
jgi:SpoVK/Ycf46/Vps4 family AAA+-type ATPase